LTTTKQIETRIKRQVKFEDGKVVEDTGPIVSTSGSRFLFYGNKNDSNFLSFPLSTATEDTDKVESEQTEVEEKAAYKLNNAMILLTFSAKNTWRAE
jgi:hypothetical protein